MASPRVSGARFDALFHNAREPAFWLTPGLKLVWVNPAWEELTGHSAGSVAGLVCRAHGPGPDGDLPGLAGSLYPPREALDGSPTVARTLIVHASGERRWRRIVYWPFHDDSGALFAILGLVRPLDEPAIAPDSDSHRLRTELLEVRDRLLDRPGLDDLIGRGPAHRRLLDQIDAASTSSVPVLVVGESGTGKRLVARSIHQLGNRNQSPLVALDCSALPPAVLERELFGSRSVEGRGRIALPEGSTLVLGDILDLPRDLQSLLARALDSQTRLIATTASDPDAALAGERLRPDLYYLLTTLVIRLDALRDRLDDLPLLAQQRLEWANRRGGRQRTGFSDEAMRTFLAYDWPGNIRELTRIVDEAHARGEEDTITLDDLPAAIRGNLGAAYTPPPMPPLVMPLDEFLAQVERRLIENALGRSRHNKSRAAELLGISRPRLYRRIKELNLPEEPETSDDLPVLPDGTV